MIVSTKGRYALRVMLYFALHGGEDFIPLKEIAETEGISQKYLESIMTTLSKAGFVDAVHGKGGGYRLNRKPEEYTVGEIVELMEGSLAPVACLQQDAAVCPREKFCVTLPLWQEMNQLVRGFLYQKKLTDLLDRSEKA